MRVGESYMDDDGVMLTVLGVYGLERLRVDCARRLRREDFPGELFAGETEELGVPCLMLSVRMDEYDYACEALNRSLGVRRDFRG